MIVLEDEVEPVDVVEVVEHAVGGGVNLKETFLGTSVRWQGDGRELELGSWGGAKGGTNVEVEAGGAEARLGGAGRERAKARIGGGDGKEELDTPRAEDAACTDGCE